MKLLFVRHTPSPLPVGAVTVFEKFWFDEAPDCVFFGGGCAAEELSARLSVRLGIPCCTGVIGVERVQDSFTVTRRIYGGELIAEYSLAEPCIVTLDGSFDNKNLDRVGELTVIEPEYPQESWYDGFIPEPDDTAHGLKKAAKLIAAGRGLKGKAQFRTVCELADRLGAAAGATRAVVYNGWAPMAAQVGVSGTAVSPDVCLLLAASGSGAFLSGISKDTKIIAVNSDPDAPVFRRADRGVVGDAGEILQELIKLTALNA
jgi:electron transfer flavoprotein alpha subunit